MIKMFCVMLGVFNTLIVLACLIGGSDNDSRD